MAIGDVMTSTIPAVGSTGTQYATDINAFLTEVRSRLEALIPISSLQVGTLDMVNNALINIEYALLYPQVSVPTTPTGSLQNFAGDLYWVSASGAAKITTGANVNAAGIGGITGDYGGTNPAQIRFVDLDKTYYFYDDFGGNAWAHARVLDIEIAGGATSNVRARINWAGSSSYTLTLPASLPASTVLLQLSSAGALTASNSLPVDTNITLSGTGEIKHGDKIKTQSCITQVFTGGCGFTIDPGFGIMTYWTITQNNKSWFELRGMSVGDRIKSVTFQGNIFSGTDPTSYTMYSNVNDGNALLPTTGSGSFSTTEYKTLTLNTPHTIVEHETVYVLVVNSNSVTNFKHMSITYDRP